MIVQWLARPRLSAAAGVLTALLALTIASAAGEAKTPGNTYCFHGVCHRVKTLSETERLIGKTEVLSASYYDSCHRDPYNPCGLTSSGEVYRPDRPDNAASPIYPNGTRLLVWNSSSRRAAVLRVNNAGPYWGSRTLDLSRAAADQLGFLRQGVAKLHVKVVSAPSKSDATYRRHRLYEPVPGPIGAYQNIELALLEVGRSAHNLFASPVHAVAGRQTPEEALAFARVERTRVEVKVAVGGNRHAAGGWLIRQGSAGPQWSARSAQEFLPPVASLAVLEEREW